MMPRLVVQNTQKHAHVCYRKGKRQEVQQPVKCSVGNWVGCYISANEIKLDTAGSLYKHC